MVSIRKTSPFLANKNSSYFLKQKLIGGLTENAQDIGLSWECSKHWSLPRMPKTLVLVGNIQDIGLCWQYSKTLDFTENAWGIHFGWNCLLHLSLSNTWLFFSPTLNTMELDRLVNTFEDDYGGNSLTLPQGHKFIDFHKFFQKRKKNKKNLSHKAWFLQEYLMQNKSREDGNL